MADPVDHLVGIIKGDDEEKKKKKKKKFGSWFLSIPTHFSVCALHAVKSLTGAISLGSICLHFIFPLKLPQL